MEPLGQLRRTNALPSRPAAAASQFPVKPKGAFYANLCLWWEETQSAYAAELAVLEERLWASVDRKPRHSLAIHSAKASGNPVLPLLAWMSRGAMGGRPTMAGPGALTAELLHAATLMHADVLDDSADRCGEAPAPIAYGNRPSILAGDLLIARALQVVADLRRHVLLATFLQCATQLINGEMLQHTYAFLWDVTETACRRIIDLKIASLFSWTAEAAVTIAGADSGVVKALGNFARHLARALQVLDDWLDWCGEQTLLGRAVRVELKGSKPSLAVVYGMQASACVRDWLRKHVRVDAAPPTADVVAAFTKELSGRGALRRAKEAARLEVTQALMCLPPTFDLGIRERLEQFAELAYC